MRKILLSLGVAFALLLAVSSRAPAQTITCTSATVSISGAQVALSCLATPTPVPTKAPTPIPTATPIAAPGPTACLSAVNGQPWPAACRPYATTSPFNLTLPDSPAQLYPSSAAIITSMFGSYNGVVILNAVNTATIATDYGRPVYIASASDPSAAVTCSLWNCPLNGITIPHVPVSAAVAGGGDGHFGLIEPDGTEYDFWATQRSGSAIVAGFGGQTTLSGPGWLTGSATSGNALPAGVIRFDEIARGLIPHALSVTTSCVSGNPIVPGTSQATTCTGTTGPPIGAHLQLDLTHAQIDALGVKPWEKAILYALHDYGAYVEDTGGVAPSGMSFEWESFTQYAAFGQPYPGAAFVAANNPPQDWQPVSWSQHLRIVAACYATGACTK